MKKLVIIRHGESIWNKKNIFTGWRDIKLSKKGIKEARKVGKILKKKKFNFDIAYTSLLNRAIHTTWEILYKLNLIWIKIKKTWHLNERHYGKLQGCKKNEILKKYGKKKFQEWRRSYKINPPKINKNDKWFPGKEKKYLNIKKYKIPKGESLLDTYNRVIPYFKKKIYKNIIKKKKILIVAHGNSIRALMKYIENISDNNIENYEIDTTVPLIYEYNINYNNNKINIINKYYLKK